MADAPPDRRDSFLLTYYGVLWDNINRHVSGVWQTVTTLGVSVALLGLVGNGFLSMAAAATLVIGVAAWYAATVYDSALWFARNQAIATNVERAFLDDPEDRKIIQPYYVAHRKDLLISHFQIPLWLSRGLAFVGVLLYADSADKPDGLLYWLPYAAVVTYVVVEVMSRIAAKSSYAKLLKAAPGASVAQVTKAANSS